MQIQNIIQRGTQTSGFGVIFDKCLLAANVGDPFSILQILAVLFLGTQTKN